MNSNMFLEPSFFLQDSYDDRLKSQGFLGFEMEADNTFKLLLDEAKMDIEDIFTEDTSSNKNQAPIDIQASEDSKDDYSRDCLKFCRKLARFIPEQLQLKRDFIREIIKMNSQVLASFLIPLDLETVEASRLEDLQIDCLLKLWMSFRSVLSYQKNKKICIVKQEYWDLMFEKDTVNNSLKETLSELSRTWKDAEVRALLKNQAFSEILARLLFSCNKTIIMTLILRDDSAKAMYLRSLGTIDSFLFMVMYPGFFQYYNHRSGKFSMECCGKCKVCRAKTVPKDFLEHLRYGRQQANLVTTNINQIFSMHYGEISGIMPKLLEICYNKF